MGGGKKKLNRSDKRFFKSGIRKVLISFHVPYLWAGAWIQLSDVCGRTHVRRPLTAAAVQRVENIVMWCFTNFFSHWYSLSLVFARWEPSNVWSYPDPPDCQFTHKLNRLIHRWYLRCHHPKTCLCCEKNNIWFQRITRKHAKKYGNICQTCWHELTPREKKGNFSNLLSICKHREDVR